MSKEKSKRREIRVDELLVLVKYGVIEKSNASTIALRILDRLENENDLRIFNVVDLIEAGILSANEIKDFYKNTLFT